MKIATTEKLTNLIPLSLAFSSDYSPSQSSTTDVDQTCKLLIQQLLTLLSALAVWTVYQNYDTGERQLVAEYTVQISSAPMTPIQKSGLKGELSPTDFSSLQQEKWLLTDLPVLKVVNLHQSPYYTYICCIGESSVAAAEYLMVCTLEPLALGQEQLLLSHGQILSQYLQMYQARSRQEALIASRCQNLAKIEHQLRNPLGLIHLYAENLRLALPSGSLQEQAILIRQTADQLSSQLTDLLYYGQHPLKLQPQDLAQILDQSIQGLKPWLEQKELQIEYPHKSVSVTVDAWQMKQVFDNLLTNAVYFSPQGGIVRCNWYIYNQEILVEISDCGSGIPLEDLKHIFKPYYSRRSGGTGLGLAIAQEIIVNHQGNLWVDNIPEGGAQFSFTLPR